MDDGQNSRPGERWYAASPDSQQALRAVLTRAVDGIDAGTVTGTTRNAFPAPSGAHPRPYP